MFNKIINFFRKRRELLGSKLGILTTVIVLALVLVAIGQKKPIHSPTVNEQSYEIIFIFPILSIFLIMFYIIISKVIQKQEKLNALNEEEKYKLTKKLIKKLDNTFLEAIKIKNYFTIKNIEIIDLKNKKEIYFVGENGDGKTILLQAILLALKKEYSGFITEYIKKIKHNLELSIKYELNTETYSSNINIKNIFAYGINRNKVDSEIFDEYGYSGIFDTIYSKYGSPPLKNPFYELGKNYKGNNPLIKEFIKKLNTIVLQENYKIFDGGDIAFNELSEGYKSTIIWLYDLTSRLIENQKESKKKVKKLADFKAIVLVDEIDLYLHPKWKYDFVNNLRKVFPNIQFIMITHSIVTILGARKDAVFYKVYKENEETKISEPISNLSDYTANILSTSPLFDMQSSKSRAFDENNLQSSDDYKAHELNKSIEDMLSSPDNEVLKDDILKQLESYNERT